MLVIDDLTQVNFAQETSLTIGAFDGVHRGHQYLIRQLVGAAHANGRLAGLITFHPHPNVVLARRPPLYLTTPGEKVALLEQLRLDLVTILRFDQEMARTSAADFMALICRHLHMKELWVGQDFALGKDREGDVSTLRRLGAEFGFTVHVIEPLAGDGEAISSTRIRQLLLQGQVREASRLLGRYPSLAGRVVAGVRRGHRLGVPTANLEVRPERAIPADGVYAAYAVLGDTRYPAVANIGYRPSFESENGNRLRTVETHILDFDQNIYGFDLVVEFVERLRAERRFASAEELVAQIHEDIRIARELLATHDSGVEETGDRCLRNKSN
ncbi:MAG: bifunctional riboflavin kinase/FAD synthetase [Anaerolineae bacterium]|jgi:riboflavin kinase/FMN adenylyltransferase|nr:bifunctional riboflavin kinase/FAD synthetase [Anaerolineae bacterium]MDH7474288.1 bifunctional riboflavin kinase/FAD synthetase [Anaerolineae bacterium]